MRRPLIALTIALAALVAACSPSVAPGWTYAPPTPPPAVTPAPSGSASAAPSGAPSAAPSGAPSAAPSDNGAGGSTVDISASGTEFEQKEAAAPAGTGFVIHFDNKDSGIPHNVEIKDANNQSVFRGTIITGPQQTDYNISALAAGTYQFVCSVHANMVGTLKVGG